MRNGYMGPLVVASGGYMGGVIWGVFLVCNSKTWGGGGLPLFASHRTTGPTGIHGG